MSAPAPGRQTGSFGDELTNAAMIGLIGVFALTLLLRGAGSVAAFLTGTAQPLAGPAAGVGVLFNPGDPATALEADGLSVVAYWIVAVVLLGLLASPSQLPDAIIPALVIGSALTFVARPISVFACLTPFREKLRTQLFISWAGMRGALPIMLATIPLTQDLPGASHMFHVIFLLVVTFTLVQGPLLPRLAPWAGVLEQISHRELVFDSSPLEGINASLVQFRVPKRGRLVGMWVKDLRLPRGAVVAMVIRNHEVLIPDQELRLQPRDQLLLAVDSGLVERVQGRLILINKHGPLARWIASGRNRRRLLSGG